MLDISQTVNALRFYVVDENVSNQTSFVLQTGDEATDAEVLDLVDKIISSDYVQNRTGATAVLDGSVQAMHMDTIVP